jgi:hypothetical protein
MANEFFIIMDKGDDWEITGTFIVPEGFETSNEGVLDVSDNKELFDYVKNRLKTHAIRYSKELTGKLIQEDLVEIPYNLTEIERMRKITQGKEYLSTRIGIPEVFEFVEFIILNNYLIEKGYVITDENRHEKYLEIVETGDLDLIEKLESFLESRDSIMTKYSWFNVYKNFTNNIHRAQDVQSMNEIWKEYVQTFE